MSTCRARRFVLALILAPIGCSGSAEPEAEATAAPVDSRFATAEAMVEYFNSLTTTRPVRVTELLGNVYTENVIQERIVKLFRSADPIVRLNQIVEGRFGEPLDAKSGYSYDPNQPAAISTNDGQRAEAAFVDEDGQEGTLHLVKIGDRWWFSGYTFEYLRGATTDIEELAAIEEMVTVVASVSSNMIPRVQAGEFTSLEECKAAYGMAIIGYMIQHPGEFENLERAIKSGESPIGR